MDDIEIASGFEAIAKLQPVWTELQSRAGLGAFERFELVHAAARLAEDAGSEPLVAVFRRDGQAEALLPLKRERFLAARVVVPLVHPLAQYTNTVGASVSPEAFVRLCACLEARGVDVVLLRKVRADSGLHEALLRHGQSQRAEERALYIDLARYGTFSAYDASFSGSTRRNRRQRRQRFEAQAGALSFEVMRGSHAEAAFDKAIAWKREWLAERGLSSPVFDQGAWEALLRDTVSSGAAIVTALRAGSTLVAVEVGFADRNTYVAYLGAFDPAHGAVSPGQEQMLRTIAWCFEQGFERYDLLAPTDEYKRQWARTDTGVSVDDYAIPLSSVGRGVAEVRRYVRPLARDIYRRLSPEVRAAGGRYGMPAAAAAMCAGAMLAVME